MGYSGLGMQRWISNMKPRKFLSKRSKPDGGGMEHFTGRDISEYYHLNENKLENLLKKKYSPKYRLQQQKKFIAEQRTNFIKTLIGILISILILVLLYFIFQGNFKLF